MYVSISFFFFYILIALINFPLDAYLKPTSNLKGFGGDRGKGTTPEIFLYQVEGTTPPEIFFYYAWSNYTCLLST